MKKMLAGLSVAGLVAGVTLGGCQKASGSCSATGCSKTEKTGEESAGEGMGSCAASEDTAGGGTGSCAGMKDTAGASKAQE